MEVFYWPGDCPPALSHSVVTLGVFDGVHVGHRRIIRQVTDAALRLDAPSVVITFDQHPEQVVEGRPAQVITSLSHRLRLLDELGLALCVVIRFTQEVAGLEAAEFARTVLRDMLHAGVMVVGVDCRFGRRREGDVELLRRMHGELGMDVVVVEPVSVEGEVVSSTGIRKAIREADLARAELLLGRPFSLFGTVVPGDGRGRKLGYPTANLDVHAELLPREGVYASWALTGDARWPSVTSVGTQETFVHDNERMVVETHILDAEPDLYGRDVEIQFVKWLRRQRPFPSPDALAGQMAADIAEARLTLA